MNTEKLKNLLVYSLIALLSWAIGMLLLGISNGTVIGFRAGEPLASGKDEFVQIMLVLSAGLTMWLASNRPRLGSEALSRQVNEKQAEQGVSRDELVVLTQQDIERLKAEAARLERIRPLRERQEVDERLERLDRG